MANFPVAPRPSYPIEETYRDPEVLVSKHRDGSEQRRYKGAGQLRIFRMSFGSSLPITNVERQVLISHYNGELGKLNSFTWVHAETGEAIKVRYAGPYQFRNVGYNFYEAQVELEEVPA